MHLLQRNTDLNMIRSWLGHSSIETTHGYVEIDLDMKRRTLQACKDLLPKSDRRPKWQQDEILAWLSRL
jgi:site-specific recombinase XerD